METQVYSENIHARGKSVLSSKSNVLSDVKNTMHTARKAAKPAVINQPVKRVDDDDDDQHNHQCCELAADKEMERTELRFTQDMVQFYSNFQTFLNPFQQACDAEPQPRCPDIEPGDWIVGPCFNQNVFDYEDMKICVSAP